MATCSTLGRWKRVDKWRGALAEFDALSQYFPDAEGGGYAMGCSSAKLGRGTEAQSVFFEVMETSESALLDMCASGKPSGSPSPSGNCARKGFGTRPVDAIRPAKGPPDTHDLKRAENYRRADSFFFTSP